MKKIITTELIRPRSSSGVSVCRMMLRMIALTVSAAPEIASRKKLAQNQGEMPKSATEAPYATTAQRIAGPCRRIGGSADSAAPISTAPSGCAA